MALWPSGWNVNAFYGTYGSGVFTSVIFTGLTRQDWHSDHPPIVLFTTDWPLCLPEHVTYHMQTKPSYQQLATLEVMFLDICLSVSLVFCAAGHSVLPVFLLRCSHA